MRKKSIQEVYKKNYGKQKFVEDLCQPLYDRASGKKKSYKQMEEALWSAHFDIEGLDKVNGELVRRNYRLEQANRKLIEALQLLTDDYKSENI